MYEVESRISRIHYNIGINQLEKLEAAKAA